MFPNFQAFGWTISTYLPVLLLSVLASSAVAVGLAPRFGLNRLQVYGMAAIALSLGLIGSKAQSILLEFGLQRWMADPTWLRGFAVQGGLVLGMMGLTAYSWWRAVGARRALDLAAPAAATGVALGRTGCLLAGCCWGKPTLFPISLVFYDFDAVARPIGVPLHATQLYAMVGSGLIAVYLMGYRLRRRRFDGQLALEFILLYGLQRFLIEFLRADLRGPSILGLSTPQWIVIVTLAISGPLYVVCRQRLVLEVSLGSPL